MARLGRQWLDVHVLDLRAARPAPEGPFEAADGFFVTFRDRFDAPVRKIPDVAREPFDCGSVFREKSEPDALHDSGNQITASHHHRLVFTGSSFFPRSCLLKVSTWPLTSESSREIWVSSFADRSLKTV